MAQTGQMDRSRGAPLVLREVGPGRAALVRAFCGPSGTAVAAGTWWELSDPAGPEDEPPQAVVVGVQRSAGVFELLRVVLGDDLSLQMVTDLADQVVVLLRRTDVVVVCSSVTDGRARAALIASGFENEHEDGARDARMLWLRF